ncbi:MAG: hypothetical protein CMK07_09660 [Ponticaulis sp.]|nr:hypothetical protein [Ponticaulis sp.]
MTVFRTPAVLLSIALMGGSAFILPSTGTFLSNAYRDFATVDIATKLGVVSGIVGLCGFPGILMALPFIGRSRREVSRLASETARLAELRHKAETTRQALDTLRALSPASVLQSDGDPAAVMIRAENDLPLALTHFVRLVLDNPPDPAEVLAARAALDVLPDEGRSDAVEKLNFRLRDFEHPAGLQAEAPATGLSVSALNSAAQDAAIKGKYELALRFAERALSEARETGLARTRVGLDAEFQRARALRFLDRNDEALRALEDLLPIEEAVLGPRHKGVLSTRFQIAQTLFFLGRHDEALRALEDLLPIEEAVLGPRHKGVLSTRLQIAQTLRFLGRHDEALSALEELLPVHEAVLGSRHYNVLFTRFQFAQTLGLLGRHDEALGALEDLLPVQEAVQGPRHQNTLSMRAEMANAKYDLGRKGEALSEFRDVFAQQSEVLPPGHPDLNKTADWIAGIESELANGEPD